MKILEAQSAVLSNYEVLSHLSSVRSKPRPNPKRHQNVETILKEVSDYLSSSLPPAQSGLTSGSIPPQAQAQRSDTLDPSALSTDTDPYTPRPSAGTPAGAASSSPLPPYAAPIYTPDSIKTLITRLAPHLVSASNTTGLYKSEVLMIINLRPQDLGMLDCIVEECDERFTEQQQGEILQIVADTLGVEVRAADDNGDEGKREEQENA